MTLFDDPNYDITSRHKFLPYGWIQTEDFDYEIGNLYVPRERRLGNDHQ